MYKKKLITINTSHAVIAMPPKGGFCVGLDIFNYDIVHIMNSFETKEHRIYNEEIYTKVAEEIESSTVNKGLWAKALAESGGDFETQKALYIKFRVQSVKDEIDSVKSEDRKIKRKSDNKNLQNL